MARFSAFRSRWMWLGVTAFVSGLAGWAWVERGPLLAQYYARQLASAPQGDRGNYLERLVERDGDAIPPLVEQLHSGDEMGCANCGWALAELARRWGTGHPNADRLAEALAEGFIAFSPHGRRHALEVLVALLGNHVTEPPSERLAQLAGRVLSASRGGDGLLLPSALDLAAQLLHQSRPHNEELLAACRSLASAGLRDGRLDCRVAAVRVAAAPGVESLAQVVPLLSAERPDPAPEVRRVAVIAIGAAEELVPSDDLLHLLHDPDLEVQAVCEQVLKSRRIMGPKLQLARDISDPQPSVRARVPLQVVQIPDLDTKMWLDRLSRDQSPAVRAAMIHVVGEGGQLALQPRLVEMASTDPSPTVKQIAAYYFRHMGANGH